MKSPLVRLATTTVCTAAACMAAAPLPMFAQAAAGTTHHTPTSATAAHRAAPAVHPAGCVTVPALSPKIPTLLTSLGCAKPLYTITSAASQLSPLLSAPLKDGLEKLNQSFTLGYIDTRVGTGALAQPKMYYTVNYTGYLVDGTKFDTSEGKEPITFPYGARRVIQGWDTGFEGMHVGGKRRLFVPFQLAYGEGGRPPVIPAKAELVFDVELVGQSDKPPTPPAPPAGASGATGASGAIKVPLSNGAGQPSAKPATPPAAGTPPVTSTTPATPPSPTGATPKQ